MLSSLTSLSCPFLKSFILKANLTLDGQIYSYASLFSFVDVSSASALSLHIISSWSVLAYLLSEEISLL